MRGKKGGHGGYNGAQRRGKHNLNFEDRVVFLLILKQLRIHQGKVVQMLAVAHFSVIASGSVRLLRLGITCSTVRRVLPRSSIMLLYHLKVLLERLTL